MKFLSIFVLACALLLGSMQAEAAKRLGGGSSFGKQSSNVTKREAAPGTPAQNAASNAAKPAVAPATTAAPPVAPKRPWGAMLGGLAAGLGLAWLAHSMGMGGAFGNILMFALLAFVAMALIGWFIRSRSAASNPNNSNGAGPFALQGAGGSMPRSYSPENVGNDASARPWERNSTAFDSVRFPQNGAQTGSTSLPGSSDTSGSMIGSALAGSQSWGVPAGFDTEGFLKACKANFVTLQDAWDRSDIASLRAMMTDEMVSEITTQLAEREQHNPKGGVNKTEVAVLNAQLLGIEDIGEAYMASVEFSGMIREDPSAGPSPFREVWNMTKPRSGGHGWLVAGVQALQ
jgi:predicted lipid-binding transport protein (Tim44 family)